ncbi:MAG: hypothetical protein WBA97_34320 [Actinophytocola sp.]|uniref:hypothetical protein n=1 Tax=Actinophytocola sp. TaxID=1872138 RepID=UPI003C757A2F
MTDARRIIERHWPLNGPHTNDTIAEAAQGAEALMRYLAHATYEPITAGPALHRTLSSLHESLYMLDQVLGQVADGVRRDLANDYTLYDTRSGRLPAATALDVADAIGEARQGLGSRLYRAASEASCLGHTDSVDENEVA